MTLVVDQDIALIGRLEARENFPQGRFAGAVFAQNADDLPMAETDINVVIGVDGAKAFMDVPQFDIHRRGSVGFPKAMLNCSAVSTFDQFDLRVGSAWRNDFQRDDMRVAGGFIGAIGDHGKLVPAALFGVPVHSNAIIRHAAGFAFARLLQLLVDVKLNALDADGWIGGVNLDVKNDALDHLLVVRWKEYLHLGNRRRWHGRRQWRRRHQVAGAEAGEDGR